MCLFSIAVQLPAQEPAAAIPQEGENPGSWLFTSEVSQYHGSQSEMSSALTVLNAAIPALLLLEEQEDLFELPIAYATALGTSYLAKNGLKRLFGRQRPDAYIEAYGIDDPDSSHSFPSGHTTINSTISSFLITAYSRRHAESSFAVPISSLSCSLTISSSVLRYTSGSHFPADIIAGAVLGSLIGSFCASVLY